MLNIIRKEAARGNAASVYQSTVATCYLVAICRWYIREGRLGSRVVSMVDSGAVGPGFKSQPRRCRVTVLGKLFTSIVPLFTKQRNWQQPS